jgi:hypothetical protein
MAFPLRASGTDDLPQMEYRRDEGNLALAERLFSIIPEVDCLK